MIRPEADSAFRFLGEEIPLHFGYGLDLNDINYRESYNFSDKQNKFKDTPNNDKGEVSNDFATVRPAVSSSIRSKQQRESSFVTFIPDT